MNTPQYYSQEELDWIIENAKNYTVADIAFELGLGKSVIYNIGTRYKLKFKNGQPAEERKKVRVHDPKLIPDPAKQVFERPAALYSNSSPMGIASSMRHL